MKLDKETLIKERFWFLLPFIALFLLISWICILGVRGETAKNFSEASAQNTKLKGIATTSELKNNEWITAMDKELGVSEAKKNELWYTEYNRQNQTIREKDPLYGKLVNRLNPFIIWPPVTREKWEQVHPGLNMNERDYGENLGNIPQDEFRAEYPQQYQEIVNVVNDWLDENNSGKIVGAVRVRGGSGNHRDAAFHNLVQPIPVNNKLILSEEAWIIEEDIAVKREFFQSLADLLNSYSRMKPEWAEVPYTQVKAVAAPAPTAPAGEAGAPAVPSATTETSTSGAATPPPAAAATTNGHAAPPSDQPTEFFQRVRFYNYVWPNFLDPQSLAQNDKLHERMVQYGLPTAEPYKGWRLDLSVITDPRNESKLLLRAVSANHSDSFKLPAMPLAVWFTEQGNPSKELPQPLILSDAGDVAPCEYWPRGGLKKISEKTLKDIPIPAGYGKIKRVGRALPENAVDQVVCFNHDWLIAARLVRQPNRPSSLNLVGEVINRSGRRLPGALFTAGLQQANTTTPLQEEFNVATDAFNAGDRKTFFKEIKLPVPPRGLEYISQKLTWRSTPIKRIERLEIGRLAHSQSDRLKVLPLSTYDFKKKDPTVAAAGAAPAQPGAGDAANQPPAAPVADPSNPFLPGSAGSAGSNTEAATPNQGIRMDRYVQVTPQLRRIPVALVMTVDATAMADIIGAMSNSRLRFQVTMAPWTRVQNLGRPGGAGETTTAAASPAPGGGLGKTQLAPPSAPPRMPPNTPPGINPNQGPDDAVAARGGSGKAPAAPQAPRMGTSGATPPAAAGQFGLEDDSSVVELQIFGIITIYESPDAQKKPGASGAVAVDTGAAQPK
jgi:hypothetical protein